MSAPLLERVPPQSLEAEQATLGAMMVEREAIARVVDVLDPDDFYSPQHQLLYRVMIDLFNESDPVDLVTVQARLQDRDQLEGVGGTPYLIELQDASPTAAAIGHYARIVREKATLRALIRAGGEIQSFAQHAGDEDVETIVARARATLEVASEGGGPKAALRAWEVHDYLGRDDLAPPAEVVTDLLLEGTVSFWFGPAGSGKSASAADMARCKVAGWSFMGRFPCERGPAVLIEQESAPALLRQRLAELEAGEPLPEGAAALTILPLQGLRLDDATSRLALAELLRGLMPKLIVCDTLAALAGGTDLLDVRQVRPLMEWFRQIATEFSAAVLLLAHTPKWSSKEPTLAALYGSEDFGAACDSAFALCRLPMTLPTFRVAQVKNRWGADLADFTFALGPGPEGGIVLTGGDSGREGIEAILLEALDGGDWLPAKELSEAVRIAGYSESSGARRAALRRLEAGGRIEARGATTKREYQLKEEAKP